ncbi:hypothetical protein ACFO0A_05005 [Novosphingobium tardum]|jgi:hypothetical protein|uniref:Uncharacterized protein n=1 Tax=Novosphingobium tardum TaxID=1538021 RepID=A0ABV8RPE0_9SPHN
MTQKITARELADVARIVDAPTRNTPVDRNFGMPTRLYGITVGSYLAFFGVMAAGFQTRQLAIPMVIFTLYVVMAFGVPALWTRMQPDNPGAPQTWREFRRRGMQTGTGPIGAGDAIVQVLLLPVLVLFWGIAVVAVAALA